MTFGAKITNISRLEPNALLGVFFYILCDSWVENKSYKATLNNTKATISHSCSLYTHM